MKDEALLNLAFDAALAAGKAVMEIYKRDDVGVEIKSDASPLTLADRAAHEIILTQLQLSNTPVLSEEGASIPFVERNKWDELWIVDPIDGTKEFIRKNGEFTINIAFIRQNAPVLGVVYAPAINTIYVGSEKTGSLKAELDPIQTNFQQFLNLATRLPISHQSEAYRIVGSRSHMNEETLRFIKEKEKEYPNLEMVSKGSSLKMCLVAEGSAHCYPRFAPTMEWDTAAGQAICRFAGKKVLDLETGNEMTYNREKLLNNWFLVE